MDDPNWTCIYSTSVEHKAEICKGVLAENDIESIIINKRDSLYLFGEVEIYVPADRALMAMQIISSIIQ